MTYLGYKISEPSLILVEDCIKRNNYALDAQSVFNFFQKRGWKNREGKQIACLETAIAGLLAAQPSRKKQRTATDKRNKKRLHSTCRKKDSQKTRTRIPYTEQLKDPRWLAFRAKVLVKAHHQCSRCGGTTCLQVHHPFYEPNRYAWEYKLSDVVVLCRSCHEKAHGLDLDKQLDVILQNT